MLVEIPDLDVLLGLVAAFVSGLIVLLVYYKVRSYVNWTQKGDKMRQDPHLEEYERQIVEMKIRMDALAVGSAGSGVMPTSHHITGVQTGQMEEVVVDPKMTKITPKVTQIKDQAVQITPNITYHNATELVLHQVTDSAKTSRDIQVVLGKSREHTSRLLKKLYDSGLVKRNKNTKPYTYSITDAGRKHIEKA